MPWATKVFLDSTGATPYTNPTNAESAPIVCDGFDRMMVVLEDWDTGTAVEVHGAVKGTEGTATVKYGLLYSRPPNSATDQVMILVDEPLTHIKLKGSGATALGRAYLRYFV